MRYGGVAGDLTNGGGEDDGVGGDGEQLPSQRGAPCRFRLVGISGFKNRQEQMVVALQPATPSGVREALAAARC